MNKFFELFYRCAGKMKGLALIVTIAPYGQWRVQVNWKDACKRGGDMIIAFAEEPDKEEAYEAAYERLNKWIETHEEDINEKIRHM